MTHHRLRLVAAVVRAVVLGVPAAVVVLVLGRLAPLHPATRWCRREADGVWRAWCRWRWPAVAEGAGLVARDRLAAEVHVPRLTRLRPTPAGAVATLRLSPGQHVAQVDAAALAIRAGMRAERVEVAEHRPGRCTVTLVRRGRDPLARPQPWPWAPGVCSWDADRLPLAVDSSGRLLRVPLAGHVLVGGLPGAGKSVTLAAILAAVAPLPVAVVLLDPKRVELASWLPRASWAALGPTGGPGGNPQAPQAPEGRQHHPLDLLDALVRLQADRFAQLEADGRNAWHPGLGPRVVVVADELAQLVATGDRAADGRATAALRTLAQLGRAAGITLVAATQRPATDTIPAGLRDLFARRIAHATSTVDMSDVILGAGVGRMAPAHELDLGTPGLAWIGTDGTRRPTLARVLHVDPDQAAAIAVATADLTPALALPVGTTA